jgi:DNA gyrase subunit A
MRARIDIEQVSPRRQGLVVRELPYQVGPERVIERIKDLVTSKKLQGISDVTDLTDYDSGLELVIEIKSGFNPQAVLDQLYKLTPLEESFHVNNVALVDGQPQTLGLKPLLEVFLAHRLEVVRRRCEFRRLKANDRLHLVAGLLIAILDIDEVIALIRASDDTANARERLMEIFDLTEIQANYILEMPLRRLTKFSRLDLEKEQSELQAVIAELTDILENDKALRQVVGAELVETAKMFGDERRTVLLTDAGPLTTATPVDLEIADEPCHVLLSASGLIARTLSGESLVPGVKRVSHDTIRSYVKTSARADIGIVTSFGRVLRVHVIGLPSLATTASVSVAGGSALKEFITLQKGESALALMNLDAAESSVVLVTANGSVKRVAHDVPNTASDWNIVRLEDGDSVVSAIQTPDSTGQIVIVTDDAQLLRFDASGVRATGRAAGCVAHESARRNARRRERPAGASPARRGARARASPRS